MNRPRKIKWLRISASACCLIVCGLLIVLWVRSYGRVDTILCISDAPNALRMRSRAGSIQIESIIHEKELFDMLSPSGSTSIMLLEPRRYSVGLIDGFCDSEDPNSWFVPYSVTDYGNELFVPIWSLVAICAASGAAPWLRWRFSLRTLLIITTLVAMVLGLIGWKSRAGG